MKVTLKQISGLAMAGTSDSKHWVTMDGPEKFGGFSAGSRPMELLLIAVAGCTGMDVISILRKKRVKFEDFSIEVEAEQAEEHPKVFTEIKIHYLITGRNIRKVDVENAIELSESKYCSATIMLKKSADITSTYEIIESENERGDNRSG